MRTGIVIRPTGNVLQVIGEQMMTKQELVFLCQKSHSFHGELTAPVWVMTLMAVLLMQQMQQRQTSGQST
jgi:hypothetical protein